MKRLHFFMIRDTKTREDYERVKKHLESLDGILRVEYEMDAGIVGIEYEDEKISKDDLKEEVGKLGYRLLV